MSRLPLPDNTGIEYIGMLSTGIDSPVDIDKVKFYTKEDEVIQNVLKYIRGNAWPNPITKSVKPFHRIKGDLSIDDGCLYYRDRIVIPVSLQNEILQIIHSNHDGIVRMKMVARSFVWWPNFDKSIEEYVETCPSCQMTQRFSKEVVNTRWPTSQYPFQRIHLDFFHFDGKTFLILVDSYSKYIEVQSYVKTDANQLCQGLRLLFRTFGFPSEIVSDNGPPFNSKILNDFCTKNGIKLTKAPVYHPQSNGLAERGVQTIKNSLKKYVCDSKLKHLDIQAKLDAIIMAYNNTPSTTTKRTPASLIFSYSPQTKLHSLKKKVSFCLDENKKQISGEKYKKNVNENKIVFSKFKEGDKILYRNHFKEIVKWIPGVVHKIISPLTYLININNSIKYVHHNQIRFSKLKDKFHPVCNSDESNNLKTSNPELLSNNEWNNTPELEIPFHVTSKQLVLRRTNRERRPPNRLHYE